MRTERMLALTDGVVAVVITIMVLELKPPAGNGLAALAGQVPVFVAYLLSFVYVAIYWNNHHHFFLLVRYVDGGVMWANFGLLFCVSLLPFATAWTGEHAHSSVPTAVYGVVLCACAVAFAVLQEVIIARQGPGSPLRAALGRDVKGKASPFLYLAGIGLSFWQPVLADLIYAGVALMWLVPDRRVAEHVLHAGSAAPAGDV